MVRVTAIAAARARQVHALRGDSVE